MTCAGNSSEYCGGPDRLNVYNYTAPLLVRITTGGGSTGGNNQVSPVQKGLPGTWTYAACYVDNADGRVIGNEYDNSSITVESCISHCSASNFTLAAIEYSEQCCE